VRRPEAIDLVEEHERAVPGKLRTHATSSSSTTPSVLLLLLLLLLLLPISQAIHHGSAWVWIRQPLL
jgi:hypothetical protein